MRSWRMLATSALSTALVLFFADAASAAPTPSSPPPAGAVQIATDLANIAVRGASWTIYYGVNNSWYSVSGSGSAAMQCRPSTFGGDPAPNVAKKCFATGQPAVVQACAGDGGTCSYSGDGIVLYGAYSPTTYTGGMLFSRPQQTTKGVLGAGSLICQPSTFGVADPAPNVPKNCFFFPQPSTCTQFQPLPSAYMQPQAITGQLFSAIDNNDFASAQGKEVEAGADLVPAWGTSNISTLQTPFGLQTPLAHAAFECRTEIVNLLVGACANVNYTNAQGYNPLDMVPSSCTAVITRLKAAGAVPAPPRPTGTSTATSASATPDSPLNSRGQTPLEQACEQGNLATVQSLIRSRRKRQFSQLQRREFFSASLCCGGCSWKSVRPLSQCRGDH